MQPARRQIRRPRWPRPTRRLALSLRKRSGRKWIWFAALIVLIGLIVLLDPYYTTIFVWQLRKALPFFGAVLVTAVATIAFLAAGEWLNKKIMGRLALLGFLIGAVGGIWWWVHTNYSQDRSYLATTTVDSSPVPKLSPRAPYQVGVAQARPNLGDTAGDIADTTYLPGQDRYATLVTRRGSLTGYEVALTQQIPLQGRGALDYKCAFDEYDATARVGGWFGHNLGRLISQQRRWVRFQESDVYAYCDGTVPTVVVPLKRQVGTWVVTEKPAGVALYHGQTGKLTFTTDTAGIPGPSYPLSLAAQQRAATTAIGSFGDWVFDRAGWETPDDDVNSGNDTEFTLDAGGRPVYITPLTRRGSATSISVVSEVPARHSGLDLAPMTVHRLDPTWVSPKAIVDRIRADYQDLPNWQTINVYEVIPTGDNSWVATLGTGQNILYRASGTGNLKGDKPTCLLRADGTEIRCGSYANVGGNGPGIQYGPAGPSPAPGGGPSPQPATGASPIPSGDLRTLTDAQLAELQRRVAEESACRLAKTCPAR